MISQETSQLFAGVQIPYFKAFGPKQRIKTNKTKQNKKQPQDELCLALSLSGTLISVYGLQTLFLPTLRRLSLWLWSLSCLSFPEPSKTITMFHWSHPQGLVGFLDGNHGRIIFWRCYLRFSFLNFFYFLLYSILVNAFIASRTGCYSRKAKEKAF